jgi:gluconolactonase
MKSTFAVALAVGLLSPPSALGQGRGAAAGTPLTETVAPAIPGVVAAGTRVRIIKTGFAGTEGPIALPDGSVIFTETPANRITKIDKDDNVTTFLENTNGSNALAFDTKGRLITVQTVPGQTRVGVIYPKGSETVLADNFEGKPFGRPNDLVVDKKGGVYFSEPGAGAGRGAPPATPPLPPTVYYIPAGGKGAIKVADGFRPNGIQLSRDETILYVNNTAGEYLLAFDIQPDGTLRNRRDFAKYVGVKPDEKGVIASGADGLAVDNDGRIYIAVPAGVQVVSPAGVTLGVIPLPDRPQNLAFAGPDKRTLYIVGRGNAYKIQMLAQGFTGRAK